jgi:hypothetical protein
MGKIRSKKSFKHRDVLLKDQLNYVFSDVHQLMTTSKPKSDLSSKQALTKAVQRRQEAFAKEQSELNDLLDNLSSIQTQ